MLNAYNRRTVMASTGAVVAGAVVTFRNEETGLLAPLYNDQAGTQPIGTSVTSGSQGEVEVFLAPGFYRRVTTLDGEILDDVRWEPVVGSSGVVDATAPALSILRLATPALPGVVAVDAAGDATVQSYADLNAALNVEASGGIVGEATERTTGFTLTAAMHDNWIELYGDVTVTIPAESTANLSLSDLKVFMVHFAHKGGGTALFAPASGVTLLLPAEGTATLSQPGQRVTVSKATTAPNTWHIYGQTDGAEV